MFVSEPPKKTVWTFT